jgi:hypothetical protein
MSSAGGPSGINATAFRAWLQTWLKPWCFQDIEFGDIAGAQTNGDGDLVAAVNVDGVTIGGNGLGTPLFVIRQTGQIAVPAGSYNVPVVLAPALAHSLIVALPNWNTTVYFSLDSAAGFTLNFGTSAPPGGGLVFWGVFP